MTSITITDPALLALLTATTGPVDVKGPDGSVVGTFLNGGRGKLPPGVKSPISDEEFERARQEPSSGITLDEFWAKVRAGTWK